MSPIVIAIILAEATAFWQPGYKVNLHHKETFEIGTDILDEEYSEMIKKNDLEKFNLEEQSHLYNKIHNYAKRSNDKINEKNNFLKYNSRVEDISDYQNLRDFNMSQETFKEEAEPWVAGFIVGNNTKRNITFFNEIVKRQVNESSTQDSVIDEEATEFEYDYQAFRDEYYMDSKNNSGFNSTAEEKLEETVEEALQPLVDFKSTPRNCTKEEIQNIGINSIKCLWIDYNNANSTAVKLTIGRRAIRIVSIWFMVYLIVAIPCWCLRGWCCCCCFCRICHPHENINEAKFYLMNNPPGEYYVKDKQPTKYEPSEYEVLAYEKLESALKHV